MAEHDLDGTGPDSETTVLVVSEHALLRWGIRAVLADSSVRVVGEAADAAGAIGALAGASPHVLVTDLSGSWSTASVLELREVVGAAASTERPCALLVLVDTRQLPLLRHLPPDVSRIHMRDATPAKLAATLRLVAAGYVLSPKLAVDSGARAALPSGAERGELPVSVTPREREVLGLVVDGLNNTEIAGRLSVSESTVKSHIQHLVTKFGLRDRAQLIIHVYRARLDGSLAADAVG